MQDCGVISAGQIQLAETLGLAMARRAAEILDRHRSTLTAGVVDPGPAGVGTVGGGPWDGGTADEAGDEEFDADNAIFTAVLDAANECLGVYDTRPADDRWCDALLQLIYLAKVPPAERLPHPRCP